MPSGDDIDADGVSATLPDPRLDDAPTSLQIPELFAAEDIDGQCRPIGAWDIGADER